METRATYVSRCTVFAREGPGEFKIVSSPDGANFELVEDWREPSSGEVSFAEHVMFGALVNAKVITLVLRRARPWKFFGLSAVELIVEPGPVLLVSGVTTPGGFQCVVDGGAEGAFLRSCVDAIADGGGKEVFLSTPEGMLITSSDLNRCVTVADGAGDLATGDCNKPGQDNSAVIFELTGGSQLKVPRRGDLCISVQGDVSAAALAGAIASASDSHPDHPPANAVDGDAATYWAAAFGGDSIDLTLSLGDAPRRIESITIDFEYPAKAFQVEIAGGGPKQTVFASRTNNLNSTRIDVGGSPGTSVRIRMQEPHPVWAVADGHPVVGIRSVGLVASSARLSAKDCADAGAAADAGDKFFMVAVPEYDPARAATARTYAELATRAGNRLAGLLADLAAKKSVLESCRLMGQRVCTGGNCTSAQPPRAMARDGGVASSNSWRLTDKSDLNKLISVAKREITSVAKRF